MAALKKSSLFLAVRRIIVSSATAGRHHSTVAATSTVDKQEAPHKVPNALSSTVLISGEEYNHYGSLEMLPPSRKRGGSFLSSEQAGREAADYVLRRWPVVTSSVSRPMLVPHRNSPRPKERGASEAAVCYLIDRRRTGRALKMYKKMVEKGEKVSLQTQNRLLDLLTFYGVGNPWVERTQKRKVNQENSASSEETRGDKETQEDHGGFVKAMGRMWKEDCVGHQFFTEMQEKDTRSYETLIAGMLKFGASGRAMTVFKKMQLMGLQPSVYTYNLLLEAVRDLEPAASVRKERTMKLLQCMSGGNPPVKPNAGTLTAVLKTCRRLHREVTSLPMQVMRELIDIGVEPSLMSYCSLLDVGIEAEQLGVLYTVLDQLERDPTPLQQVVDEEDITFFPQAARVALKLEDTSLVDRLHSLFLLSHQSVRGNPAFFFVRLLKLSALHSDTNLLFHYYRMFVPHTFIPSSYTYTTLLQACGEHKASIEAVSLWRDIVSFNVHSSPQLLDITLAAVISHIPMESEQCCEVVECIQSVLEKMKEQGVVPPRKRLGSVLFAFMRLLPLKDVIRFVEDCVSLGWSFSYPSICSLLEERIVKGDAEHSFVVLRAMAQSQQLAKAHHVTAIKKHMVVTRQQLEDLEQYVDSS